MNTELSQSKRLQIIKGATDQFVKYGFHAVSMDKVTQAASVSKATLYKHFGSKDDLLFAVIDELCTDLWETMEAVSLNSSIENNLKMIASAFIDLYFSEQGLAIYRLVISECHNSPKLGELVYKISAGKINFQLEAYLLKINQIDSGYMIDIPVAAEAFCSLLRGELHFQCLLGCRPLPSLSEKETHINQVVLSFIRGWLK